VLPPDPTRQRALITPAKAVILLVFVCCVAAFVGARSLDLLQGTDFPDFYCAARMLLDGHGPQLYDAELQWEYQARYAGRVGTLYIHPPFEAVLYLAVAWLPLRRAYLLWSLLNLVFLAVGMQRLAKEALVPWDWRVLLAASLTFAPLLLCLQQGQDSLLLLLLVILAFTALRCDRAFAAGCWLGLGLFKFQLVLPLCLVLVLTQGRSARSELAKGFGLVALTLVGSSAAISGWSVFSVYPTFLVHLRAQPFAGIVPQAMANFRGLTYFFFQREQSLWAVVVVSMLSLTALVTTLTGWNEARVASHLSPAARTQNFDRAFANSVLFALLVSYHLNPHDLSLLLLPMVVLLRHGTGTRQLLMLTSSLRWLIVGFCAVLFLPPLHVFALQAHAYALVSIPLIALFAASAARVRKEAQEEGAP
jgi:glycosyl transferase family 87